MYSVHTVSGFSRYLRSFWALRVILDVPDPYPEKCYPLLRSNKKKFKEHAWVFKSAATFRWRESSKSDLKLTKWRSKISKWRWRTLCMKKCIIIKKMTLIYSVPSIVPRKCSEIRWNSNIRFLGLYNVQVMSSPFCRFKNFNKKRKYYQRNLQMINPYWNFFQYPVMTGMLQNDVGFSVF